MTSSRALALLIGIGRICIAAPLVVRPLLARMWVGEDATGRGAQALCRGLAGRDVALGAGLTAAVVRDQHVESWLVAGALADASDFAGTLLAGDALPARARIATMAVAGGAAATGAVLAGIWSR